MGHCNAEHISCHSAAFLYSSDPTLAETSALHLILHTSSLTPTIIHLFIHLVSQTAHAGPYHGLSGPYGLHGLCGLYGLYGLCGLYGLYGLHGFYGLHGLYAPHGLCGSGLYGLYGPGLYGPGLYGLYGLYGLHGFHGLHGLHAPHGLYGSGLYGPGFNGPGLYRLLYGLYALYRLYGLYGLYRLYGAGPSRALRGPDYGLYGLRGPSRACQVTPNYHAQLPHSLVNLQLASQKPLSYPC